MAQLTDQQLAAFLYNNVRAKNSTCPRWETLLASDRAVMVAAVLSVRDRAREIAARPPIICRSPTQGAT